MTYPVLAYVDIASLPIPVAVGVWKYRTLNKSMRVFAVLSVLACIDLVAEILLAYVLHYNSFLTSYYEFIELLMLGSVFYFSLGNRRSRVLVVSLAGIFTVFWLSQIPSFYNPAELVGSTQVVSRISLIFMSLTTLYSINEGRTARMIDIPVFWAAFGVLLYSAGTLVTVGLGNQILTMGRNYLAVAWSTNWLLGTASNLFYAKAFLCRQEI